MDNRLEIIKADFDLPAHCDAIVQLLDTYARDEMGVGRPLDDAVYQRLIEGLRANSCCLVLLAQMESLSVGMAVCFLGYSTFAARPLINIHDLIVAPGFRGQGIGARLLAAVETHGRALGCCKVTLEVRVDNTPARSLYAAQGFTAGRPAYEFWTKPLIPAPLAEETSAR